MPEEEELHRKLTAWVGGATSTKMGHAILTTERLVFFDEKFSPNAAFGLANLITDHLQKKHEEGGPLLDLPLDSITGISRQKKLLNKDRINVTTTDGEYVFNDGWKELSPALRETLTTRHGRRIVEDGPDAWRVEAA